ncbi:MAG: adenylate/guanylate cyclase domain-containing protein [Acidimicrobiales bacterium]
MESPPTGTVTFLFTDIEGSTRRWQDEPEAMRALLVEHDAILRDVIDKHRGFLFKHTGDGVAAVFASAADAVAAAVDAQARLQDVLPVRMGLHTGEAELRDGDYFGSTFKRCARLMGVAHGGQVVCGAATAALVRDRDDLRDLGVHRLRDLSEPEQVFQIGAGVFAPLRSLDASPGNLPLQLSSFIGRGEDLAEVLDEVSGHRLVTLTGVGGVGKTRLALQAAAELVPRYGDGAWLVELAPVGDGDGVAAAVLMALALRQHQGKSLEQSVIDSLQSRQALVVLDNCEHLIGAVAQLVDRLLRVCPQLRVLATSREGLGVRGERIMAVRSLSQV